MTFSTIKEVPFEGKKVFLRDTQQNHCRHQIYYSYRVVFTLITTHAQRDKRIID